MGELVIALRYDSSDIRASHASGSAEKEFSPRTDLSNEEFYRNKYVEWEQSVSGPEGDLLPGKVSSGFSELWHPAELPFREHWSVMAYKVWTDYAGSAYSDSALEHSFEAYLDVAFFLYRQIVDQFHHGFWTASVDSVEIAFSQHVLDDPWYLVLLSVGPVVSREQELEVMVLAFLDEPILEQKLV